VKYPSVMKAALLLGLALSSLALTGCEASSSSTSSSTRRTAPHLAKATFSAPGHLICSADRTKARCVAVPSFPGPGGRPTVWHFAEVKKTGPPHFAAKEIDIRKRSELYITDFSLTLGGSRYIGPFSCSSQRRWYIRAGKPDPRSHRPVVVCFNVSTGSGFVIGQDFHTAFGGRAAHAFGHL
jgi:hypothetical protein